VKLEGASCDIYAGKMAGKVLEDLIRGAEDSIRAYSPFLSPMVTDILEKKSKKIPVELFTTRAKGNNPHRKALRKLRGPFGFLKRLLGRKDLKVGLLPDNFHAKVFLIDDVAVLGSANLTYSGMRKNFEVVTICRDLETVMEIDEYFAENFG
jgi:phosphatidylserine/phosphatidylglycerophosphate/cardiolipin synthase-like enzyme